MKSCYKNLNTLATLNSGEFLKDRNQLLLSFINGCCNIEYQSQYKSLILFSVSVAVEVIYFIRNLNLVLPHCFLLNLMQSFVSGSKTVSSLNGKISPSGGYTTYKKWLEEKGNQMLTSPDEDVVTYFDNIGKYVIKAYRVATKKNSQADIITTTFHYWWQHAKETRADIYLVIGKNYQKQKNKQR